MKREFDSTQVDPVPYFKRAGASTGLWNHIFPHLQLKRRSTTSNPYANSRQGFHTTFYDIRETKHLDVKELWKQGPLYDHPLGWHFRRCAYTVSSENSLIMTRSFLLFSSTVLYLLMKAKIRITGSR